MSILTEQIKNTFFDIMLTVKRNVKRKDDMKQACS